MLVAVSGAPAGGAQRKVDCGFHRSNPYLLVEMCQIRLDACGARPNRKLSKAASDGKPCRSARHGRESRRVRHNPRGAT
jgi:hypothetical protein